MKIGVVSSGHTKFGKLNEDIGELMYTACKQAIENINIGTDKIDAIYISNFSSSFSGQSHLSSLLASKLSVNKEITRVESACASGGLAIKEATLAILSGLYDTVLVVGVEKMSSKPAEDAISVLATSGSEFERQHGATFPSLYALVAQRYCFEYKVEQKYLAKIAVKNHRNAIDNPLAQFHKKITINEVLNSPVIASPLKLLDCSPLSDGAAAVILCRQDRTAEFTDDPVFLVGIGHDTETINFYQRSDLATMPTVVNASAKAFEMANVKPADIDVAEVHDCFTIAELLQLEDLGFCRKGKAKDIIDTFPINPDGGLKAKGHPIGATGVSQVVEIFHQLRREAGRRQVKNAKTGLCCNIGGVGSSCVVSIFSR